MNFNKIFLSSLLLITITWSCVKENEEDLYPININNTDKISFENDIQPILETNCFQCHSNTTNSATSLSRFGDGVTLEGEENVKKIIGFENQKGYLINNIKHVSGFSKMPRGGNKLSDQNIELIEKWIEQEFTIAPNPTDTIVIYDTTKVIIYDTVATAKEISYKNDVLPILKTNCYNCHDNANNPTSGFGYYDPFGKDVTLEGYDNVKTVIEFENQKGYLINNIKHVSGFTNMPWGSNKLPDSTITKIETWIAKGFPNN